MRDLTLIIPAKNEGDSLPKVLNEIKSFDCKKIIILESSDITTIEAIKNFNCEILYQSDKGYGNALIEGLKKVKTEYLCIFNADGSFDPKYLYNMLSACKDNLDFVFASRYIKDGGSDDDTFITKIGNFIFTKIGNIFFSINISDILYTYLLGRTDSFKKLNLNSKDFCLCVEMPIKAKRIGMNFKDFPSYERKRIAGEKKVNEFKDGLKILLYMIKSFFRNN
ncbi:glycosyltransferase family 2 protein [Pelagibacterales bacterium SAG-MED47]|nr:glycosyltransferase family 2 protein [Pelagibacterales bacterium SAG-MED47]|tara:strand:+ start:1261 stop:1929 length:669 start_codon:yes stop_codon:yes gene_type:complete